MILDAMVRLLAPVLAFTSNEIWQDMPHAASDNAEHIMLNDMPEVHPEYAFSEEEMLYWDKCMRLRNDVNKALELARAEKIVGKPLDAEITLYVSDAAKADFAQIKEQDLPTIFIVSKVHVVEGEGEGYKGEQFPGITVKAEASALPKCVRCWAHSEGVGADPEHPELCPRCAAAVK